MARKAALCLIFLGMLWVAGCSGGSFISTTTTQSSSITSVNVSCAPATLDPGQTSQCSATVTGTGTVSNSVTWSAGSGSINNDGIYTAPSAVPTSGVDTVIATSNQDSKKSGAAAVKVVGQGNQVISVGVTASPSSITTAQTAQCIANVSGHGNYSTAVNWTATGGTITQSGVFTPSGAGTGTCVATSTATGSTGISGSATITIAAVPAAPSGPAATVTSIGVVAAPASITTAQTATCAANVAEPVLTAPRLPGLQQAEQ